MVIPSIQNLILFLSCVYCLTAPTIGGECIEVNKESNHIKIAIFGDTRNPITIEKFFGSTPKVKINHISNYLTLVNPNILLHTGDLVKFGSKTSEWKFFRRYFSKFINHNNPPIFFPVIGNHDINFIDTVGLKNYFETFPYLNQKRWYCVYINKDILILNLDSNYKKLSREEVSSQNRFIEETLKTYNNRFNLLLSTFHHPIYRNVKTLKIHGEFVKNFQKIFDNVKQQVLFINGHFHNFFYKKVKPKTALIITGGAGAPLHTFVPELLNKHHIAILKIDMKERVLKIKLLIFKSPKRFYFKTVDRINY